MKEIEFDSDRYYVLRHDLETDSYDDYVYANAVAGGEIESVDVCDKRTVAIRTRTHGKQGGDKDCLVKIRYLDDGRWGPHSNDKGNRAVGCWFEKMPEVEQDDALFENCVFLSDIKLEGSNDVAFHNCFFLGSVNIEGCRNIYEIDLEHCIIKGDLTISNCETDVLSIWNCNVFRTVMIADCQVKKTVSMCDLYIKLGLHIRDSGFYGHESKLRGAKIGYGIEISDCDYDVMTEISLCKAEEVRIKDTVFKDLTMDCISTHSYFDYEHLIDNDSDTLEKGLIALPDNNDESDGDGLSKRENRFDNAMGTAVERKSSILFSNTTFNGITELSDITASLLGVCGCRAYDDFQISKQRMDSSYEAMEKYESDFCDTTERNYALQFIDLSGTIFYESTEISNVYRFICMNNTRFKEYCYIDADYLNVTEGLIIRRLSGNRRLIDEAPQTIQELFRSCDRNDQGRKQHLHTDAKTVERSETDAWKRLGFYGHELLSNYGKSPTRVLITMLIVIGMSAIGFYCTGFETVCASVLNSFSSFFTIGLCSFGLEDYPKNILIIAEGAVGFILMTYFIVVLCDRKKLR